MADDRCVFRYHLKRTADGKIEVREGSGWVSRLLILVGPTKPATPERPLTKAEFYALTSELAGRGYQDNLMDFDSGGGGG
ncbi:MAG: hypothetical protein J2P46_13260 [Zavarzinella sp.]|nr:hypothetical protein [Zavarzinella sp.]